MGGSTSFLVYISVYKPELIYKLIIITNRFFILNNSESFFNLTSRV